MVDVQKLIGEFRQADLQAYIDDYNMGDLAYKQFFPSQYTPFLTFEALQQQFSAKVAADVVAFDSRAPRKGRPTPGKVSGDLPKIEIARVKKESDLNTYRQLLARIGAANNQATRGNAVRRLIDWMYEDGQFVLDGVNARMEYLAKQIASTGKMKLTLANNEGGVVTAVDIDFGIPSGNVTSVTTAWATAATATPIADIRAKQVAARAKGIRLMYAITDQETIDKMLATEEVQKSVASFANNALGLQQVPTLDTVNGFLRGSGLPQFIVWDSYVNLESKAGVMGTTSGWTAGNIVFSQSNQLGNSQYTDTADGFVTIDDSTKAYNDFVLVKAFAEQDPITVVTKGVAYAAPVLNNANNLYILKTVV